MARPHRIGAVPLMNTICSSARIVWRISWGMMSARSLYERVREDRPAEAIVRETVSTV